MDKLPSNLSCGAQPKRRHIYVVHSAEESVVTGHYSPFALANKKLRVTPVIFIKCMSVHLSTSFHDLSFLFLFGIYVLT